MNWKVLVFIFFLLSSLTLATNQQQAVQQSEGSQTTESIKPPRVVGQAQSQEEWDAWQAIEQATEAEKIPLVKAFLQNFPESGLTANAHFMLARHYDQMGDLENYMFHAEKTLEDLPDTVDFLARLAFFYSEQGKTAKAIQYANRALGLADQLEKPAGVSAMDFVTQRSRLRAEANYALGRASLSSQKWKQASDYLNKALDHDPSHDYACFRLALAERNLNNPGKALMAYARAVAIGSVAAGPSQAELEKLLQIIRDNMPDSEWAKKSTQELVQMAASQTQKDTETLNDNLALEAQELEAAETGLGLGVAPPPPPPPSN